MDIVFLKQNRLVRFGLLHKALLRFLNLNVNLIRRMDICQHVHQLILDIEERVLSSYFHSIQDFYWLRNWPLDHQVVQRWNLLCKEFLWKFLCVVLENRDNPAKYILWYKCFTYVTKTIANLTTYNRKLRNYNATTIF